MKYTMRLAWTLIFSFPFVAVAGNPPLEVSIDGRPISAEEGGSIVSYADILDRATPSVVSVYTARFVTSRSSQNMPELFRYFGRPTPLPEIRDGLRERKEQLGVGSGVIISSDGYILTNHHVVEGMSGLEVDEIKVLLNDGEEYKAILIGSDAKTDIAVLKIEVEDPLPIVQLADSGKLRVGDVVFAIGNPLDVGLTATQGIVSAVNRNRMGQVLGPGSYENFIQTDASINLGNSGGALIDARGRLVGINTAIVSGSGGSIGIGFAIPVNMALNVARNLIKSGEVPRGMLGLFPDNLTRDMADAFGLKTTRGALVNQVQEDSPASRGGIIHGDIITHIDEVEIDSAAQLRLTISQILPGTVVRVKLIRQGVSMDFDVILGSLNGEITIASTDGSNALLGVSLSEVDERTRDAFSIPLEINGLIITDVANDSPYTEKLDRQMVILEINGNEMTTVEDVAESLVEGKPNRFYVWVRGTKRFVIVKL